MASIKNQNRKRATHKWFDRNFKRPKHPNCEIDENGYYLYPCELCGKPVKVSPKWYQNMYKLVPIIAHENTLQGVRCPT